MVVVGIIIAVVAAMYSCFVRAICFLVRVAVNTGLLRYATAAAATATATATTMPTIVTLAKSAHGTLCNNNMRSAENVTGRQSLLIS